MPGQRLAVRQTATGYWVVQSGAVTLGGAVTRKGAEAERDLFESLRDRNLRRGPRRERSVSLARPSRKR
jgi:hypothetical protein